MSIIEINDLAFRYSSEDRAVNGISLNIEKGEFVCVLGHNGSGKSTLAKLIVGLLKANKGTIKINNIELTEDTVDELRKYVGIVFIISLFINMIIVIMIYLLDLKYIESVLYRINSIPRILITLIGIASFLF